MESVAAIGSTIDDEGITRPPLRCLVSSVPSDAHTWGLVTLQLLLEQLGHTVTNLGSCPPQELILDACRRLRPDLLVLSTTNGHGHLDGARLIRRIRADSELKGLHVVIGGKLSCTGDDAVAPIASLHATGFDAVFDEADGLQPFVALVRKLAAARGVRGIPIPVG